MVLLAAAGYFVKRVLYVYIYIMERKLETKGLGFLPDILGYIGTMKKKTTTL